MRTPSTSKQQMTFSWPRWRTSIAAWRRAAYDQQSVAHEPPPARARPALDDADLRGPFDRRAVQRALPAATSPRARRGSRSRSTCRRRPATTPTTSSRAARSARSACRSRTRATCTRCSTASRSTAMNTSMTINATAAWLLALYIVVRGGERDRPGGAPGHDPERHHQGVPLARDLRVPARPVDAADRRHRRLHGRARAALEPGQHLLLPPAGGGRDAGAGDRLRDGDRDRRARRGPRARRRRTAWARCSARISFFVNAGVRFVEEHAKLRAMARAVGGARALALRRDATSAARASATACRSTRSA